MRIAVAVTYFVALIFIFTGMVVLIKYQRDLDDNVLLMKRFKELKLERDARESIYAQFEELVEANRDIRTDWLSLITIYRGKSPESLLYDLEKITPHNLRLTNFAYNRYSGVTTINAVSFNDETITNVLESLEQLPDYSKVVLLSKNDVGAEEGYRYAVKIEQTNSREVNE